MNIPIKDIVGLLEKRDKKIKEKLRIAYPVKTNVGFQPHTYDIYTSLD